MAKNYGLSCPLCLTANDPIDMLGVAIEHAIPLPIAAVGLCKRCVVAIVRDAMATELITPDEVFGNVATGDSSPADTDGDSLGDPPTDSMVPGDRADGENAGEHRSEPKMPAGGERKSGRRRHGE